MRDTGYWTERDEFWSAQRRESVERGDDPEVVEGIDAILADVRVYRHGVGSDHEVIAIDETGAVVRRRSE